MLITLSVPENTTKILYCTASEDGTWETEPKPITFDMIVKAEQE